MPGKPNLYNPGGGGSLTTTELASGQFVIAAGGAGWVDTDVSATTGTDTSKIWLVYCYVIDGSVATIGARSAGSAVTQWVADKYGAFYVKVSATGHMEFYRNNVSQVNYNLGGYIK